MAIASQRKRLAVVVTVDPWDSIETLLLMIHT